MVKILSSAFAIVAIATTLAPNEALPRLVAQDDWKVEPPDFSGNSQVKSALTCIVQRPSQPWDGVLSREANPFTKEGSLKSSESQSHDFWIALAPDVTWIDNSTYSMRAAVFAGQLAKQPVKQFDLSCSSGEGTPDDQMANANIVLHRGTATWPISIEFPVHGQNKYLSKSKEEIGDTTSILGIRVGDKAKYQELKLESQSNLDVQITDVSIVGTSGYCSHCLEMDFTDDSCKGLIQKQWPRGQMALPICLRSKQPDDWPGLWPIHFGHSIDTFQAEISYRTLHEGLRHDKELRVPVQVQLQPSMSDLFWVALISLILGMLLRSFLWYISPARGKSKDIGKDLRLQIMSSLAWISVVQLFLVVSAMSNKPLEIWSLKMYPWLLLPCFLASVLAGGGPPLKDLLKEIGIKAFSLG